MNEQQAQTDHSGHDLDIGAIVMVGVVSLLVLAVVVISSWAWFNALRFKEQERQAVEMPYVELENLQMDQPVSRDFKVKRTIGRKGRRAQNPADGTAMIFPAKDMFFTSINGAVMLGVMPDRNRLSFHDPYKFSSIRDPLYPRIEYRITK